jgi:hypothetical protein
MDIQDEGKDSSLTRRNLVYAPDSMAVKSTKKEKSVGGISRHYYLFLECEAS